MCDSNLNLALAHGALAISSGWALMECTDLKYVRIGFCFYLANGIVGVIDYVLPRSNCKVKKAKDIIARWARPIYLPLIAAEAILYAGFDEKYSYCHLILPGIYLLLTELLKKNLNTEFLDLSTIVKTVSLCFSAYTKEDIYGGGCALLNLAAFMGTQFNSMEYLLLIGLSNIAAVQFFKQYF